MLVQGWYAATPTFPPTTNVGPTYLCYQTQNMTSADIVHEFQAYSHLGEKGGGGGGGTLIFSYIRRPGPFLVLTFWCFVMTPKDIHKIFIPQKIFIFLKTLKGIEIQNFEPQNVASPRMNENIIVPPPPPSTLSSQIETGSGGVQTQITEKTLISVFFVGFFCNYIFYGSKGSKHLSGGGGGGGGATFYYYFFWGVGGGCKSLFL